jgi:L-amino acid N-acyltransferase YncA
MSRSTTDAEATLRDGRRVTIRPIRRDDIARTAAFIDGLSASSKHTLFLGGVARLSDSELERLCDSHDARDMAFVATAATPDGEREVGVCRYAGGDSAEGADAGTDARARATQGTVAEISVAVADDWQHQGLGKLLLRRLIEHAHRHGVRRLFSMDASTNEPMRRLALDLGFSEQPDPDDIHQVIYSWEPPKS